MERHIHESNLIEQIDDPKEDRQSMKAWLWLLGQKRLDHSIICHLQKRITVNQRNLAPNQRGYYRGTAGNDVNVRVGKSPIKVDFHLVKESMDHWLRTMPKLEPLKAHIVFEEIHPFADGNGRTGRMIMWWQELHAGRLPTLFTNAEKHEKYYPLFKPEQDIEGLVSWYNALD